MNEASERRSGATRLVIALVVALLVGYAISPYISFWFFARAIRAKSISSIEWYVDFPAVRAGLKEELRGYLPKDKERKKNDPFHGLLGRLAPSLIDQLVDAFVTPDGVAALLTDPDVTRQMKAKNPAALADTQGSPHEFKLTRVQHAFFTGPKDFAVEFEGKKLHFRFSHFHWQLKRIELPPNE